MRDLDDPDFALGTLGARVRDLRCRFLVLPEDPESARAQFDEDFWNWWRTQAPRSHKGTSPYGNEFGASAWGAVWYQTSGDESWDSYLCLSQSGALDVGIGHSAVYKRGDMTVFRLLAIIGRLWTALNSYQIMIERMQIPGPFEISLGIRAARGSLLGHLASGWTDVDDYRWGPVAAADSSFFGRWEREEISDAERVRDLAFEVGDWIEQCWGSWQRRFVTATRGEGVEFDWGRFS
jgi:hypothetical protein